MICSNDLNKFSYYSEIFIITE